MRISMFGGSTDYKSFYEKNGSLLIGTAVNKYAYSILRNRPTIVGNESVVTYSKIEKIQSLNEIQNPLIRETLKYFGVENPVELNFATDVPSRTGLGGSSSCCVSLVKAISILKGIKMNKRDICLNAIKIEREVLKEPGGIQDQIWATYGGFNTITINKNGSFSIRPVPTSQGFLKHLESCMMLVYSEIQRTSNAAADSHDEKYKMKILEISKQALIQFKLGNVKLIGELLYESWKEKKSLSHLISDNRIDDMIGGMIFDGAYGAKLLGSGSGGFILVICNKNTRKKIKEKFKDAVVDFAFENGGLTHKSI